MLRFDTSPSKTTSSNENLKFNSNYNKLIEKICKFSNEREKDPFNINQIINNPTVNKLNSYKLNLFVKDINNKSGPTHKRNLSKSTNNKENLHIDFERIKINPDLKYKYKSILENGLHSTKIRDESKIFY